MPVWATKAGPRLIPPPYRPASLLALTGHLGRPQNLGLGLLWRPGLPSWGSRVVCQFCASLHAPPE
jgi:hypothetical protein